MLRYAFRRFLWTLPTLVGVSIASFLLLSFVPDPTDDPAMIAALPAEELEQRRRERFLDLPRFVNLAPRDVRSRAEYATRLVAEGGPGAAWAERELVRLGGAGLPFVVPAFDALAPEPRAKVARALAPIARRMGLAGAAEAENPRTATAFWTRFWDDRGIEFRLASVRSDVSRLLRYGASETATDLRELDTFALPELFAALQVPDDASSAHHARLLVDLIADATGRDDRIDAAADVAAAQSCVERWFAFWNVYRGDFSELRGPSRVSAMLVETRYGKWAFGAVAYRFGPSSTGAPVLDELRRRAPVTLAILFGAIALGYAAAVPLGVASAYRRGRRTDLVIAAAVFGLHAVPTAVAAVVVARAFGADLGMFGAIAVLALSLVAAPTRQQRSALATMLGQDWVTAARARGAGPARALFLHGVRNGLLPIATLSSLETPMALGGTFVVERVFGLEGIGELTIRAVQVRDTSWLMALSIAAAALAALCVLVTDVGYVLLDPRLERSLFGRGGRA